MFGKKFFLLLAVFIVVLSIYQEETEARRKILRGRKTITRRYYRGIGLPGYLQVILYSFGNLLINGLLYFGLHKYIISSNQPPPVRMEHEV